MKIDVAQLQRQRVYNYYIKVKDNVDHKDMVKIRTHEYYIHNEEWLTQKERLR